MNFQKSLSTLAGMGLCLSVLAACSSSKDSAPTPPAPNMAPFRVNSDDQTVLDKVGCKIESTTAFCTDPRALESDDRMAVLQALKKSLSQQIQAINQTRKKIEADLADGKIEAANASDARALIANMLAAEADLTKRSMGQDLVIEDEEAFEKIIAYNCEGSYAEFGKSALIKESIPTYQNLAHDFKKDFPNAAINDLNASLKYDSQKNIIAWSAADSLDGKSRNLRHSIETDGEFSLKSSTSSGLTIGCYHLRGQGYGRHLSDPSVSYRYMNCKSNSKFGEDQGKGKSKIIGWEESFPVNRSDKKVTVELGRPSVDLGADSAYTSAKYGVKVISDAGLLTFAIYNQASGVSLLEVKTSNATKHITLTADDPAGNAILLSCGN